MGGPGWGGQANVHRARGVGSRRLRVGVRSGRNGRRCGGLGTHDGRSAGSRATSRTRARGRSARTGTPPWLAPRRESRLGTASRAGDVARTLAGAEPLCKRGIRARENLRPHSSEVRFQQRGAAQSPSRGFACATRPADSPWTARRCTRPSSARCEPTRAREHEGSTLPRSSPVKRRPKHLGRPFPSSTHRGDLVRPTSFEPR